MLLMNKEWSILTVVKVEKGFSEKDLEL